MAANNEKTANIKIVLKLAGASALRSIPRSAKLNTQFLVQTLIVLPLPPPSRKGEFSCTKLLLYTWDSLQIFTFISSILNFDVLDQDIQSTCR